MAEWRDIPGYEGRYRVSDDGRILSLAGSKPRLRKLVPHKRHGYLTVQLKGQERPRLFYVHRLVAEAFIGPRPEGQETRHVNGVKTDNRLLNLAYGTSRENGLDMVRHGTSNQSRKTHCPQGHEYNDENTYRDVRGYRWCRICNRASVSRYKARRRASQAGAVR